MTGPQLAVSRARPDLWKYTHQVSDNHAQSNARELPEYHTVEHMEKFEDICCKLTPFLALKVYIFGDVHCYRQS